MEDKKEKEKRIGMKRNVKRKYSNKV